MSAVISPFPRIPFDPFKIFRKIATVIKSLFTPPKPRETPEDVIERQRAFQNFCDQVHQEASQMEGYVVQELERYGSYLNTMSASEAYSVLKRYHVNTRNLLTQLEILKMQIPGIIRAEVSRRLSDTDGECTRIRRMLPGAEKEAQMHQFLESILSDAMEKCASTTESIMEQIQNLFVDDLQECLNVSRQQLETVERGLTVLSDSTDEAFERMRIQTSAEQVIRCSDLIIKLFD